MTESPKDYEEAVKLLDAAFEREVPHGAEILDAYLAVEDASAEAERYLASFAPHQVVTASASTGT